MRTVRQTRRSMKARFLFLLASGVALAAPALAQQYVDPAKGQSAQQQKSDEAACYTRAVQQQAQAATQQGQAAFGEARAACLQGRGYTVKQIK